VEGRASTNRQLLNAPHRMALRQDGGGIAKSTSTARLAASVSACARSAGNNRARPALPQLALQRERGSSLHDEPRQSTNSFERFLPADCGLIWRPRTSGTEMPWRPCSSCNYCTTPGGSRRSRVQTLNPQPSFARRHFRSHRH